MSASTSQPQPNQQSNSNPETMTAIAMIIGLYLWADSRYTRALGRALNMLRNQHDLANPVTPIRLLQREERRIVDTLDNRTPQLLALLTTAVEHDSIPHALPRRTPPAPPVTLGLLEPPEPPRFDFTVPLGVRATEAIHTDLQTELKDIRARILRQHDDLYKLTAAGAATNSVMANGGTITDAQRSMMTDLLTHGVTGFTDRAGRRWRLSSYVEMAVRTAAMRSLNEAHLQVMQAAGITLFQVPSHLHTCPLCFPWQGRILSVDPDADADGTIDEARAAGLWHPNCEHSLTAWRSGDKRPEPQEWSDRDQQLWESSQKQRELERHVREQKSVYAASHDPQLRKQARVKIRGYQKQLRDLTDTTGLLRRSHREQPDLGLRH
ncbi:MAG: phage minor capsid protein [Bifidobacterium aquikefiri]|uniref:Phage capsid protein n=1 Tax=Bifidobacterium aquikefiri TaxID=1653207 RepID=A0A261G281_9BIFI|nr:phage minor capsid protein [Bifidobacterium aquikefiri]OZG65537.1 phage capsid protein [Bifidobacterium aquikefiri]